MAYDIILSPTETVNTGYTIKQGDYGNTLRITLQDIDYSGADEIKIVFRKADGNFVEYQVTQSNGVITYTMTGIETQCPGQVVADVKIYKENSRQSTASFIFDVIIDTYMYSKAYSDSINTALAQLQQAIDAANTVVEIKRPNITNQTNISVTGYAADARQLNPDIDGSLANKIKNAFAFGNNDVSFKGSLFRAKDRNNYISLGFDQLDDGSISKTVIAPYIDTIKYPPIIHNIGDCFIAGIDMVWKDGKRQLEVTWSKNNEFHKTYFNCDSETQTW